jgi:cysteine desulfuration protein SufE
MEIEGSMGTIPPTLKSQAAEIVDRFKLLPPEERLKGIIDYAKEIPPLGDHLRCEGNMIQGCLSKTWLHGSLVRGRMHFEWDSESMIVKGILGLMVQVCEGQTPEAIVPFKPEFLAELGLHQHLSVNRRNGLSNVWQRLQSLSMEHLV